MDLKQALNDVAAENKFNEQFKEAEDVTIKFNPDVDDVKYWIQEELQYDEGWLSGNHEDRKNQIEWSLKLLQIQELQEISLELEYINEHLRNIHSKQ